jgi:hypothetical protein
MRAAHTLPGCGDGRTDVFPVFCCFAAFLRGSLCGGNSFENCSKERTNQGLLWRTLLAEQLNKYEEE